MNKDMQEFRQVIKDIVLFSQALSGIKLRSYQEEVAEAVVESVIKERGLSFVVIFPRQSGKNELQAQLETYLLLLYYFRGAEMVKVSPTWKPQSQNAMRRLESVLKRNPLTKIAWQKESGYIYRLGTSRMTFLSGAPTSNVVGATAATLLACDEAQDVLAAKWDKEILPMAASTNATRVFWGTAWTSQTLLAREKRLALAAERSDGIRRVFVLDADQVRKEVKAYGRFVDEQVSRLGRQHPFVRTQYYSEEIDEQGGMFPLRRRQLMQGNHPPQALPQAGGAGLVAFLIDVGGANLDDSASGQDLPTTDDNTPPSLTGEISGSRQPGAAHDATALTIVVLDLGQIELLRLPVYRVAWRQMWRGADQPQLFSQITSLAETWEPRYIVVDATGLGAGLAGFLSRALGSSRVLPFTFSRPSKSRLGWDFLAVVETGRFKDYRLGAAETASVEMREQAELQALFWRQVEFCSLEILSEPGQMVRWGVADGRSDPATGEALHDDLLVSAALCALLDGQKWGSAESALLRASDPLAGMGEVY